MERNIKFNTTEFTLERYPKTKDKSLRAWSNAELLVLEHVKDYKNREFHLYNDRFGVWNSTLHNRKQTTIWTYASQQKAIKQNLSINKLSTEVSYKTPLDTLNKVDVALMKIPKSLELFELFLYQIQQAANEKTEVICGFMTKYFSTTYLKIAAHYFEVIEQTKAWKKARLLILKSPKSFEKKELINKILWKEEVLKQYYGVFSSERIDIGTQFLLSNLEVRKNEKKILDVAAGNGVIAYTALQRNKMVNVTLVDDFNLAIESSKLNLPKEKSQFICTDIMDGIENDSYDLIVSNPPFHFEYENNIEVSLNLFNKIANSLKENGRFVMVANKHLNYKTHLDLLFTAVTVLATNSKFIIYECIKQ
ncbi:class I SAM-dependent methyltransferase [Tenacibaculum amylolyticum]|uniref:class I SAM-dependent methyltransferase n=1 Tax=Tenacibaculum amylolyticum TaxID=104269 RepID=UPI00389580C3